MKSTLVVVIFLLATAALGQQSGDSRGVIYGIALGQNGQPAKWVRMAAFGPRETGNLMALPGPGAGTDQNGKYRIVGLHLGTYVICADDQERGYSTFDCDHPVEVELTAERPEAEAPVYVPPQDGFLVVHVANQESSNPIKGVQIELTWTDTPGRSWRYQEKWLGPTRSSGVVLVPPDKDVVLHVSAAGFHEWQEHIDLPSGTRLKLDVQLAPVEE